MASVHHVSRKHLTFCSVILNKYSEMADVSIFCRFLLWDRNETERKFKLEERRKRY